ncbi:MAG: hypothetical protein ACHQ50_00105 [Fimbriimonadales bacterium]
MAGPRLTVVRLAWLVLLSVPFLAFGQRKETGVPIRDVPRLLQAFGYEVQVDSDGEWLTVSQNDRSATLMFDNDPRDSDHAHRIYLSRMYELDRYLDRKKLAVWREMHVPDLSASSLLDGKVIVSSSESGDPTNWDVALQEFFGRTRSLERQLLIPEGWKFAPEFRPGQKGQPPAKLVDSTTVDSLEAGDERYLTDQWGWLVKSKPLGRVHGDLAWPILVKGQALFLQYFDNDGEPARVVLTAIRPTDLDRGTWATSTRNSDGAYEISAKIDISKGITLRDLRLRIEDFALRLKRPDASAPPASNRCGRRGGGDLCCRWPIKLPPLCLRRLQDSADWQGGGMEPISILTS